MTLADAKKKETKGERTKRQIKEAVLALYAQRGIEALNLEDILAATRLTVGAFYFHFSSKEALFETVAIERCAAFHEALLKAIDWERPFDEVAYDVIQYYYQSYIENPMLSKFVYSMVYKSPKAYTGWRESRKAVRDQIENCVRTEMATRAEKSPIDPAFAAHWLLSSLEDFLYSVFIAKALDDLATVAAGPDAFVRQQALLWRRCVSGDEGDGWLSANR